MKVFILQIHSWPPAGCPVLGDSTTSKADTIIAFWELREQKTLGRLINVLELVIFGQGMKLNSRVLA